MRYWGWNKGIAAGLIASVGCSPLGNDAEESVDTMGGDVTTGVPGGDTGSDVSGDAAGVTGNPDDSSDGSESGSGTTAEDNACDGVTCSDHGVCESDGSGAAVCVCDGGYVAQDLECTSQSAEPNLLRDGFESADMSTDAGFNAAGFVWEQNNRTSVVTTEPACDGLVTGDPTVVFSNGPLCNGPIEGRDWTAREGDHSLRFRYPGGEEMSEQRFNFGDGHYPELWVRYWLRVPTAFTHGGANNKLLALWVDTYDIQGDVTWQTRPDGAGGANVVYQDGGVTSGETDPTPFIAVPEDRGRWMQLAAHYASASSVDAHDGVIELYRRWDDETEWTLLHQKLDADTFEIGSAEQGIGRGYFMGWANDPYDSDTEWLLDDVEMSTTSLAL